MLSKTFFKRVEVFEKSINGVVPSISSLALHDRNDFLWSRERASRSVKVFVSERENRMPFPVTTSGYSEEIELAYT